MTSKVVDSLRKFNSFAVIGRSFLVKIHGIVYEAKHSPRSDAISVGSYVVFMQGKLKDIGRVASFAWMSEHRLFVSVDTLPNRFSGARDIFTINNLPLEKITHILTYYHQPETDAEDD